MADEISRDITATRDFKERTLSHSALTEALLCYLQSPWLSFVDCFRLNCISCFLIIVIFFNEAHYWLESRWNEIIVVYVHRKLCSTYCEKCAKMLDRLWRDWYTLNRKCHFHCCQNDNFRCESCHFDNNQSAIFVSPYLQQVVLL